MRMYLVALLALPLIWAGDLSAQLDIRREDHFWRKRVVQRLDLGEKINQPLVQAESNYYRASGSKFPEADGIVRSLINGLKTGEYVAYHPEDWDHQLNYEDIMARMREFEQAGGGFGFEEPAPEGESSEEGPEPEDPFADPFAPVDGEEDPFAPMEDDDWDSGEGDDLREEDTWETGFDTGEAPSVNDDMGGPATSSSGGYEPDMLAYEESFHIVEDWIFDRNRSMMVQQIDYFEVIWTDPMGTLPEKILARFLWEDVKEQLDHTQWKGRFNDAENRSIAEAIELRIFHAYPISVGGEPISTLEEAEKRRLEMIEFEHHLWSY